MPQNTTGVLESSNWAPMCLAALSSPSITRSGLNARIAVMMRAVALAISARLSLRLVSIQSLRTTTFAVSTKSFCSSWRVWASSR